MTPSVSPQSESQRVRGFASAAARLMADRHCENIRLLDVRGLSQVCDYILIASGTSDRQMKSVADELGSLGDEFGERLFRTSRDTTGTWIVADFIDLVAHLFEPAQRAYYDLDGLWSDAPRLEWKADGDRDGAG